MKLDPSLYHFHTDMELCGTLLIAAQEGDLSTLIFLHNLGFNLNYGDYDGRQAAHMAAQYGQVPALRYLRNNGAAIDEKDRWGRLPVDEARDHGHEDVVKLLRRWMAGGSPQNSRACSKIHPSDQRASGGDPENVAATDGKMPRQVSQPSANEGSVSSQPSPASPKRLGRPVLSPLSPNGNDQPAYQPLYQPVPPPSGVGPSYSRHRQGSAGYHDFTGVGVGAGVQSVQQEDRAVEQDKSRATNGRASARISMLITQCKQLDRSSAPVAARFRLHDMAGTREEDPNLCSEDEAAFSDVD